MSERTLEVLGLLLLCGLRFGIPILLTFLLAWGLKRLDAHWRAEAEAKANQPAVRAIAASQIRCWEIRGCPPQHRQTCPAYAHSESPCWEVHRSNGHLLERCRDCRVFGRALALAGF